MTTASSGSAAGTGGKGDTGSTGDTGGTGDASGTSRSRIADDAEPRWLTPAEQDTWQAYVQGSTLLEDHLDRQLQGDAGMPHIYYALMVYLARAPRRRMRMTELARAAKITRSRLSHAVARLEKYGWVQREECPSDKRGQNAYLTEEGNAVLARSAPGHVTAVRQAIFDRLTPEQVKQFGEIMWVIAKGLQPEGTGADLPWRR
ncbi:MarR family winged helix-turn-helix transcriptional regulator [Streptomyces liangshanensis]|uniref:MarR family winged helix-turn-helix transcriptional regulator n=1 Tax=Streptomyces liangshanensis TaxID=2717324 RepID=UPI0036DE30CA